MIDRVVFVTTIVVSFCVATVATAGIIFIDDYGADSTRGRFVMEAENYSNRLSRNDSGWWEVDGSDGRFIEGPNAGMIAPETTSGSRGNYVEMLGAFYRVDPTSDSYGGPLIDYQISIKAPGRYDLYARWAGHTFGTDSLYAFILKADGTPLTDAGPDYFVYHDRNLNWEWERRGIKDTPDVSGVGFPDNATWIISEPGKYTVRIAGRESLTALDALIFQTINLDAPTGLGPPQSQFIPEPTTAFLLAIGLAGLAGLRRAA